MNSACRKDGFITHNQDIEYRIHLVEFIIYNS
ncbi:MAG: hypothetical protein ACI849_000447, partial [Patiriisocius sp.]